MLTASAILTYAGQNLIVRSDTEGKKIDWLYFKAGDGDVATIEEIKNLTDIAGNTITQPNVALVSAIDGSSYFIAGQYSNEGFIEQKQVREYALFAKLEGDANPILYSYLGLGSGFVMPPYTGIEWFQTIEFITIVSQDTMVNIKFNPTALVDMETFMREMAKKVDKTSIKTEQLTNTDTDIISSSASRNLFENGAGGECLGYIEDGGQHTPHATNFWISKTLPGQFRCLVSNSDTYVDANKWLPIDDNSNASKLQNLENLGYQILLATGKTLDVSAELKYEQYLVTASHDNLAPSYLGIISGSTSYYGVHSSTFHSTDITVTQGSLNVPLKFQQTVSSLILITFTPLGRTKIPLQLSII